MTLMAIALMLSACAQTGPNVPSATAHDHAKQRTEASHHNAEASSSSAPPARHAPHETAHRHDHPPPGPTPEEEYAATVALLISAQIFACAFVVVILDGSCNFYASTGYYY